MYLIFESRDEGIRPLPRLLRPHPGRFSLELHWRDVIIIFFRFYTCLQMFFGPSTVARDQDVAIYELALWQAWIVIGRLKRDYDWRRMENRIGSLGIMNESSQSLS